MDKHTTHDPLVAFLYQLMRDYITPGKVEKVMQDQEEVEEYYVLSNGFLARYAEDIVDRLRKGRE